MQHSVETIDSYNNITEYTSSDEMTHLQIQWTITINKKKFSMGFKAFVSITKMVPD